jgi:hypothetical protein
MTLPALPELSFTDSGLVYEGRTNIDYQSIEAITFKLVPLLQNLIPQSFYAVDTSYPFQSSRSTAKFALHLAGGETVWLSRGWDFAIPRSRVEAICAAAEFLSERTFDQRFRKYREQYQAEDRFCYDRYHFCRNGDILKSGQRLCNVHDSNFSIVLGPFHIHFERKETLLAKLRSVLGQLGHTIDISRDRDCFLSMYRLAYGTWWADENYRDTIRGPEQRG